MNRPYFYKDGEGKIRKYIYCDRCFGGPYVDGDKERSIYPVGSKSYYCTRCMRELGLKGYGEGETESSVVIREVDLVMRDVSKVEASVPVIDSTEEVLDHSEVDRISGSVLVESVKVPVKASVPVIESVKVPVKASVPVIEAPVKASVPVIESVKTPVDVGMDFGRMTGREIVEEVYRRSGKRIGVSLKSKVNIIRHARLILSGV